MKGGDIIKPLIKWPGGKSSEISKIEPLIPEFDRYIEPFFGGGALFFHLNPSSAAVNDISFSLINFYTLVQSQDSKLKKLLLKYNDSFVKLIETCETDYSEIHGLYTAYKSKEDKKELSKSAAKLVNKISNSIFDKDLILNKAAFLKQVADSVCDKICRTVKSEKKAAYPEEDLKNNLITGFTSGFYLYFRSVYNDINLDRIKIPSLQYEAANFYFIREYCYGSMFRFNSDGEFNIPYGGMSYNGKNFKAKIDNMFNSDVEAIFKNTDIYCSDFEDFFNKVNPQENDFMFLDPPYDTEFSDYDGNEFDKADQKRLADYLKTTKAKFIMVIKNTDFIFDLYKDDFNILSFDNKYSYNVKSRNERDVKHLIITNIGGTK